MSAGISTIESISKRSFNAPTKRPTIHLPEFQNCCFVALHSNISQRLSPQLGSSIEWPKLPYSILPLTKQHPPHRALPNILPGNFHQIQIIIVLFPRALFPLVQIPKPNPLHIINLQFYFFEVQVCKPFCYWIITIPLLITFIRYSIKASLYHILLIHL